MAALDPFAVLPIELSLKILSQNFSTDQDLVVLWTDVRNVSRRWRMIIDDYVRVKHLPTTNISFSLQALPVLDGQPLGSVPRTLGLEMGHLGKSACLTAKFTFDRISSGNPSVAIFSDRGDDRASRGVMIGKLQQSLQSADELPEWRYPLYTTRIRHFANDTLLPGLQIDWVTLELRCDWRAVYTHLLYEEKLRLGLTKKWISGIGAGWRARSRAARDLPPQPVREETLPYRRCGAWHDNSSREARKRRLMRYTASSGQGSWVAGRRDFAKIEELKIARVELNRVVFADEDVVDIAYVVGKEGTAA
ncbi:hypothetical protein MMC30_005672 [Trapelia coarctata]|nr:hypothetical protein [Trapelia coarctata]